MSRTSTAVRIGQLLIIATITAWVVASCKKDAVLEKEHDRQFDKEAAHTSEDTTFYARMEKSREEAKVEAEHVLYYSFGITWLITFGTGLCLSGASTRSASTKATTPPPPPVSYRTPVLARCKCNVCSGPLEFNDDGVDYRNPPTIQCPHCGMETILYESRN